MLWRYYQRELSNQFQLTGMHKESQVFRRATTVWLKQFITGIQSKMLRIVKNMYAKVKSCVK